MSEPLKNTPEQLESQQLADFRQLLGERDPLAPALLDTFLILTHPDSVLFHLPSNAQRSTAAIYQQVNGMTGRLANGHVRLSLDVEVLETFNRGVRQMEAKHGGVIFKAETEEGSLLEVALFGSGKVYVRQVEQTQLAGKYQSGDIGLELVGEHEIDNFHQEGLGNIWENVFQSLDEASIAMAEQQS